MSCPDAAQLKRYSSEKEETGVTISFEECRPEEDTPEENTSFGMDRRSRVKKFCCGWIPSRSQVKKFCCGWIPSPSRVKKFCCVCIPSPPRKCRGSKKDVPEEKELQSVHEISEKLHTETTHLNSRNQPENQQLRKQIDDLQHTVHTQKAKVDTLKTALQREKAEKKMHLEGLLSQLVSVKLRDNNPNIVDLNDQFRPTKLAEMFSELYDNEWTSAYTVMEDSFEAVQIINFLLDIVMESYYFCRQKLDRSWQDVTKWYLDEDFPWNQQTRKALLDGRKINVQMFSDEIGKEFQNGMSELCVDQTLVGLLTNPAIEKYFRMCVSLCLLMNATDPPVCLQCPAWKPPRWHSKKDISQQDGTKNPGKEYEISNYMGSKDESSSSDVRMEFDRYSDNTYDKDESQGEGQTTDLVNNEHLNHPTITNLETTEEYCLNQSEVNPEIVDAVKVKRESKIDDASLGDINVEIEDTHSTNSDEADRNPDDVGQNNSESNAYVDGRQGIEVIDVSKSTVDKNNEKYSSRTDHDRNNSDMLNMASGEDNGEEMSIENNPNEIEGKKAGEMDEHSGETRVALFHTDEEICSKRLSCYSKKEEVHVKANSEPVINNETKTVSIFMERAVFDKDHFKEYTKRGNFLDYIVWPVLLLHENGPMLGKGVAQGSKEQYCQSKATRWVWWK